MYSAVNIMPGGTGAHLYKEQPLLLLLLYALKIYWQNILLQRVQYDTKEMLSS